MPLNGHFIGVSTAGACTALVWFAMGPLHLRWPCGVHWSRVSEVREHIPCQVLTEWTNFNVTVSWTFIPQNAGLRVQPSTRGPTSSSLWLWCSWSVWSLVKTLPISYSITGQFGGPGLAAAAAQAVPLLCEVIQAPDSRAVENINPTENAISAVTKILQFNGSAVNLDQVLLKEQANLK